MSVIVPSIKFFATRRHRTRFLDAGPEDGPLMFFLHGWPEISEVWRSQLQAFAEDGWRCIAPDMRGYGGSSIPSAVDAYTQEQIVADMLELHDSLGGRPAVWVGHDWGSVVAGSVASHAPERCRAVVLIAVPYFPTANALDTLVPLVDRTVYPTEDYPDGQWDYYRYYTTHFSSAVADLDADKSASLASIFQSGDPTKANEPASHATVTRRGGRFGAAHRAPPTERDPALWPARDFTGLVEAFDAGGFRGPCAWYLNDKANKAYAAGAQNGGQIACPVLFLNGEFDPMNSIVGNRLGEPMRASCSDLSVENLQGGHWLPLERKIEVVDAIRRWLIAKNLWAASA